jgi:hypothetical protein
MCELAFFVEMRVERMHNRRVTRRLKDMKDRFKRVREDDGNLDERIAGFSETVEQGEPERRENESMVVGGINRYELQSRSFGNMTGGVLGLVIVETRSGDSWGIGLK